MFADKTILRSQNTEEAFGSKRPSAVFSSGVPSHQHQNKTPMSQYYPMSNQNQFEESKVEPARSFAEPPQI
jgi:hypothetical protein